MNDKLSEDYAGIIRSNKYVTATSLALNTLALACAVSKHRYATLMIATASVGLQHLAQETMTKRWSTLTQDVSEHDRLRAQKQGYISAKEHSIFARMKKNRKESYA